MPPPANADNVPLSVPRHFRSQGVNMKRFSIAVALVSGIWLAVTGMAEAAPCLIVTLTGTQSGPSVFNGQAGAGTLVRYGEDGNDCGAMKLQFDTGRGTNMRLSQIDVTPSQLQCDLLYTHAWRSYGRPKDRHRLQLRMQCRFSDSPTAAENTSRTLLMHFSSPARSPSAVLRTALVSRVDRPSWPM